MTHLQFPWLLRATMRSPLRSPAQVEGTQGFLPQPGKALERPSSPDLLIISGQEFLWTEGGGYMQKEHTQL